MLRFIRRLLLTALGLFVFSVGEYLTIRANIGLSPWSCLSMGASGHLPLSYGTTHVCISLLIVVIDLLLGERIGFGTILDALEVGVCVDLLTALNLVPEMNSLPGGIAVMCAGLLIMAFGQFIYMKQGLGCGPRDSLVVGLGRRVPKVPIGAVEVAVLALALLAGWALGGPVGVGTVLSAFGVGIAMQLVFRLLRFEPRSVTHEHMLQTLKGLREKP